MIVESVVKYLKPPQVVLPFRISEKKVFNNLNLINNNSPTYADVMLNAEKNKVKRAKKYLLDFFKENPFL